MVGVKRYIRNGTYLRYGFSLTSVQKIWSLYSGVILEMSQIFPSKYAYVSTFATSQSNRRISDPLMLSWFCLQPNGMNSFSDLGWVVSSVKKCIRCVSYPVIGGRGTKAIMRCSG